MMKTKILALVCLLSLSHSMIAQAESPVDVLNYFIKKGTCTGKDDWCPISAEQTNTGFALNAKSNLPIKDLVIHYDNLTVACYIWRQAKGPAGLIIATFTDDTGEKVIYARKCQ